MSFHYYLKTGIVKFKNLKKADDTWIDRLLYQVTTVGFFSIAAAILAKNYFGQPLQCWVPSEFNGNWENFAERYCFVENTYFVPMNESNLPEASTRESKEIIYYQWVPFYLVAFGMLCVVPKLIWMFFSDFAELDLSSMVEASRAVRISESNKEEYNKMKDVFVQEVQRRAIRERTDRKYLWMQYFIMKLLMIASVTIIFSWIYSFHPIQIEHLGQFLDIHRWQNTGYFPRTVFCDFQVRELGQTNNYSVQCVLVLNMFNEKIFIAALFWIALMAVFQIIDFIHWIYLYAFASNTEYISGYIEETVTDKKDYDRFITDMVKTDGIFMIRLIESNSGTHQAKELVNILWSLHFHVSPLSSPSE